MEALAQRRRMFGLLWFSLACHHGAWSFSFSSSHHSTISRQRIRNDHHDVVLNNLHNNIGSGRCPNRLFSAVATTTDSSSAADHDAALAIETTEDLNDAVAALGRELRNSSSFAATAHLLNDASQLLDRAEDSLLLDHQEGSSENGSPLFPCPNRATYSSHLASLAAAVSEEHMSKRERNREIVDHMEDVFERMKRIADKQNDEFAPTRVDYNSMILARSKQALLLEPQEAGAAADRCQELLEDLWSQYYHHQQQQQAKNTDVTATTTRKGLENPFCPSHGSYVVTLTALARSRGGRRAAERAESLLEEMERHSSDDEGGADLSHLRPNTTCVNVVL